MLKHLNTFFEKTSPKKLTVIGGILVLIIGFIDYLTGHEISFSIFYIAPIIVVTWYASIPSAIFICLFSGLVWFGMDFISKHLYSHSLIPIWNATVRVIFFFIIMSLLSKIKSLLNIQKTLARTDALTGLHNSRAFKEKCQQLINLTKRFNQPLTLGYVDIDDFKKVNDQMGHSEGDKVLQVVGKALSRAIRSSDIVGRLGGDEFGICSPDTHKIGAQNLFKRIRNTLQKEVEKTNWPIGFSIGVAIFPKPRGNIDDLLKQADNLMYRVKQTGKNTQLYEEQLLENPKG